MQGLTISQVARKVGLQSSAIRYYEEVGVLPPAHRIGGQRRYDSTVLYRLAVVQRARQIGFTLDEIRQLFLGFRGSSRAPKRWQRLSRKKLAELDDLMEGIQKMRNLLQRMAQTCQCETLEECGKLIMQSGCGNITVQPVPRTHRRSR